jgi:hypothetical protein
MGDWKADRESKVDGEDEDTYLSHRFFLWVITGKEK